MSGSDHGEHVDVPVLIAGGGLVGLSSAMFLALHGIPSTAIERMRGGSSLPRAAHFHLRTLELFRLAGIEDQVRAQSEREFLPEGAIVAMDSLAGRKLADIIPSLNQGVEEVSPCRRLFVSQPGLEPILRARARAGGANVVDGYEVVDVRQDDGGVTVVARELENGDPIELRGQYLVAADGAHSVVRELLGIPFVGRGAFSNSITIYFTADLRPQMENKPLSVIYISNPAFGGFFRLDRSCESGFLVVNTIGDASSPAAYDAAIDTSEDRLVELVRIGAGVPGLPVRIDGLARWRSTAQVAATYQHGRVFLAGDAAHVMPPNGGFGGNTGIHDAYDLAWKLAQVLRGHAPPALLATYDSERRPVGQFTVEQAYTRYVTRTAPYLGTESAEPLADDLDVELGYLYHSGAVSGEDDATGGQPSDGDARPGQGDGRRPVHDDPRRTRGRPGSRLPHMWLRRDGHTISSIDLAGDAFTVLTGPAGQAWCHAAESVAGQHAGLRLALHHVDDDASAFTDRCGVAASGALLVRPDGFVAWRAVADVPDPAAALTIALRRALTASG